MTANFQLLYNKYNSKLIENDPLIHIQHKVEVVKIVMHENINKLLENTIKLEELEIKAEDLMKSAKIFEHDTKSLKRKLWWKRMKMQLIIATTIIVALGLVIGIPAGLLASKH